MSFLGGMPDWAKKIFGGVHEGGAIVLNLFGQKKLADQLTQLEDNAGMLPPWAGGTQPQGPATALVDKPDYVVLLSPDGTSAVVDADQVVVYGGKRIDGNGYQAGETPDDGKFSFGYDAGAGKTLGAVVVRSGQKANSKVRAVLLLNGTESVPPPQQQGGDQSQSSMASSLPAAKQKFNPLANWKILKKPSTVGSGFDLLGAEPVKMQSVSPGVIVGMTAVAFGLMGGLAWYGLRG